MAGIFTVPTRIGSPGKAISSAHSPSPVESSAIDNYLAERRDNRLGGKHPDDFVFVRRNGNSLNNSAMQHLVNNWLAAAGVTAPEGEKVHLFRHTYAVAQIEHGTSIAELQALLGHKNIATTSVYLRVAAEGLHHTARATAINQIIQQTLAI